MSQPSRPATTTEVRERAMCMCARGSACSSFARGHALHLIQARVASATPTQWRDAIVSVVSPADGTVHVQDLLDGTTRVLWNGAGAADALLPGEPVAVHATAHVLAQGRRLYNVLPLD